MLLFATPLPAWQLALIIIASVIFVGLLAANATFICLILREKKGGSSRPRNHSLATPKLQKQRDALLGELENLSRK